MPSKKTADKERQTKTAAKEERKNRAAEKAGGQSKGKKGAKN